MWKLIAWSLFVPGIPIPENGVLMYDKYVVQSIGVFEKKGECREILQQMAVLHPKTFFYCTVEV